MKILLIEDIRVERKVLKHWLEESGHEVIEASDGNEGLSLYHENLPELVITDIVMPEKEGIQTIIDLRKESPGLKIFAISGAGKQPGEFLELAKHLGAMHTFVKPIEKDALSDAIKETSPNG